MMRSLNQEQQRLVEANSGLIFTLLAALGYSADDIEDWYGVAAIALCEAAIDYHKDSDYPFKLHAEAYIIARCVHESLLQEKWQGDTELYSLNDPRIRNELIDPGDITQDITLKDAINSAMLPLSKQDKYIVSLKLCGVEPNTVQRRVGASSDHIESVWRAFAEAVKAEITA